VRINDKASIMNHSENRLVAGIMAPDKELSLNYHRQTLRFHVSQELFSSYQIDTGTRLLLKTVSDLAHTESLRKILDLGCGYGPLGLTLAKVRPESTVHLVDRDALAVAFARHNAQLNKLANTQIYGSLGYDDVPDDEFDLILANIPGKAGQPAIESFLLDARHVLQPEGLMAVVVVTPLAADVIEALDRPGIELLLREDGAEHVVFHFRFSPENAENDSGRSSAFDRGVYDRGEMDIDYRGLRFHMQSVRGLPEFDTLSHQSELLIAGLHKIKESGDPASQTILFNPGQGHIPTALWKECRPQSMILVDRDLLSLRASARNLLANGCAAERFTLVHQSGMAVDGIDSADLILGSLRDSEGLQANYKTVQQAAAMLAPKGQLLVAGGGTAIVRLEKPIKAGKLLTVRQRKRNRAKRMLILQAR
jgi:16S rRNA (guanine1207-N2)-methyltransferase